MWRTNLAGHYLWLLRERTKGSIVSLVRKILVIALVVGFCNFIPVSEASAPKLSAAQLIQLNPKAYAYKKVMAQWNSKREYRCLVQMWGKESAWNPLAHNKSSGAFGIAQFMPSTWGNYKLPYKPRYAGIQITGGLRYITKRYESPCKAWSFWQKNFWY